MTITGAVKNGRFVPDNPPAWVIAMREYDGGRVTVVIEPERRLRSLRANARYWGVLVPLAMHLLSRTRDVPLSKEQVHYVLVSAFAGCDETPLGLVPVPTRTMPSDKFSIFCEKVQAWLAENGYPVLGDGSAAVEV